MYIYVLLQRNSASTFYNEQLVKTLWEKYSCFVYVLLTVHLNLLLATDKLNAQILVL